MKGSDCDGFVSGLKPRLGDNWSAGGCGEDAAAAALAFSALRGSSTTDSEELVFPCAGALGSLLLSSGRPKDEKSVFWTGGAGADGDSVAFKGIGILDREDDSDRVGAVEPESRGFRGEPPFPEL